MEKRILSILVDNTSGVLSRVAGLFSRRGYNIEQDDSVARELMLVKVAVKPEQRQGALSVADIFRAKVVDVSKDSLIMEMTGSQNKLQAFVELMADYEILELARTGITGLSRGSDDVRYL